MGELNDIEGLLKQLPNNLFCGFFQQIPPVYLFFDEKRTFTRFYRFEK